MDKRYVVVEWYPEEAREEPVVLGLFETVGAARMWIEKAWAERAETPLDWEKSDKLRACPMDEACVAWFIEAV